METRRFPTGREVNRITCPVRRYSIRRAIRYTMYTCVCMRACIVVESRVACRKKIYVRTQYHKLAIIINVLSSYITDVRFEKRDGQDGAPLTVLYAGTCLHVHYAYVIKRTRYGRLSDSAKKSTLYDGKPTQRTKKRLFLRKYISYDSCARFGFDLRLYTRFGLL